MPEPDRSDRASPVSNASPDSAAPPAARTRESCAASPAIALMRVREHDGPTIVDLDETLYLRNSTEDFIDLVRPGLPALVVLRLLELLRPWRWTGGDASRDVWRVRAIRVLFPWTARRWAAAVTELARRYANRPLIEALRSRGTSPIIATTGFRAIVTPLIKALGLRDAQIVASRLDGTADRVRGKLACVREQLPDLDLSRALVLSDSADDLPLFQVCAMPLYTVWPGAAYHPALMRIYLPGQYTSLVKRPGGHYFRRAVLQEDFAFWVLASVALANGYVHHVVGLLLLLLSFWIIYECGYVDNDRMAVLLEEDPALSATYHDEPVATPRWQPWLWSLAVGFVGIGVLRWQDGPDLTDFALWTATLVCTFAWFLLYNRCSKPSRVWMFMGLQLARTAAFTVLVPISAVGAMALAAHALSRWVPYYVYRLAGSAWPRTAHSGLIRVLFFLALCVLLMAAAGWRAAVNLTGLAILVWCTFRARDEIRAAVRAFSILKPPPRLPQRKAAR